MNKNLETDLCIIKFNEYKSLPEISCKTKLTLHSSLVKVRLNPLFGVHICGDYSVYMKRDNYDTSITFSSSDKFYNELMS